MDVEHPEQAFRGAPCSCHRGLRDAEEARGLVVGDGREHSLTNSRVAGKDRVAEVFLPGEEGAEGDGGGGDPRRYDLAVDLLLGELVELWKREDEDDELHLLLPVPAGGEKPSRRCSLVARAVRRWDLKVEMHSLP